MKKILFFVPTFSNLSETFILREIDAIDKRGNFEVHILSLKEGKAELPENLKYKVSFIPLKFSDFFSAFPFIFKNFISILKVGGTFFKISNDSIGRNIRNFLKSLIFASKISIFKFDQLHIHFLSDISTIISLASMILKKPFSISGHARDIFIDGSAVNFKVKNAKFITLCNTKAFLKCIELSGGKGRKNVVLAFHGIEKSDYEFKKRVFTATSELNVLTDGRFTPKKGLLPLSKAIISLIKDYNFKINFTIIGLAVGESQETLLKEIKDLFKKEKLYSHLNIPGNGLGVQQSEVKDIYRNSDVFIYAGINAPGGDADGVPNGLLQAAFSGMPIITTDAGSISDLFDAENSYQIEQNNPESIVDRFNEMMLDKNLHKKVLALHKKVLDNFEVSNNVKYLEELLSK
jgi:glycosyltransferase involved in cell wall biosynthesis